MTDKNPIYMVFGGEQYYAHGGANDFICTAEEGEAVLLARNLIGTKMVYIEDWMKDLCSEDESELEDFAIEITIEWTQVSAMDGKIIHSFGSPYGPSEGTKTVKYLEEIGKCPKL